MIQKPELRTMIDDPTFDARLSHQAAQEFLKAGWRPGGWSISWLHDLAAQTDLAAFLSCSPGDFVLYYLMLNPQQRFRSKLLEEEGSESLMVGGIPMLADHNRKTGEFALLDGSRREIDKRFWPECGGN